MMTDGHSLYNEAVSQEKDDAQDAGVVQWNFSIRLRR